MRIGFNKDMKGCPELYSFVSYSGCEEQFAPKHLFVSLAKYDLKGLEKNLVKKILTSLNNKMVPNQDQFDIKISVKGVGQFGWLNSRNTKESGRIKQRKEGFLRRRIVDYPIYNEMPYVRINGQITYQNSEPVNKETILEILPKQGYEFKIITNQMEDREFIEEQTNKIIRKCRSRADWGKVFELDGGCL